MNKHDAQFKTEVLDSLPAHIGASHVYENRWDAECFVCSKLATCQTRDNAKAFLSEHLCCNVATEMEVESAEVSETVVEQPEMPAEIPAEIPAHLTVELLKTGSWSFWCPVCQEGATARAFVIGGLVEHHAHCKPAKRKRKASSEPRKVRTRKSKQLVAEPEIDSDPRAGMPPLPAYVPAPAVLVVIPPAAPEACEIIPPPAPRVVPCVAVPPPFNPYKKMMSLSFLVDFPCTFVHNKSQAA